MVKQEKWQQREKVILDCAQELIGQYGFFDLKMSDLARAADISVGTLYVHFASKEDLLLGLALRAGAKRTAFLETARQHDGPALEKFIVASLLDILFSIENPELFEMEYLAMSPSVWRRATVTRHQDFLRKVGDATRMFQDFLDQAVPILGPEQSRDRGRTLNLGSWALSFGMNALALSEITDAHYGSLLRENAIDTFCDGLTALLVGAGWQADTADNVIRSLGVRYMPAHFISALSS
ncbi:TetR/AcrR family transcriptional regulator [uncultured Thalassospira sp.]|uniref:TetR/AcrR family transcriptional regulator n=1 Tax=uncultured Thalassospira sp. TaxID=404382 RepID=UPI0030D721CB|tara:strand:- start:9193 stop:9906 length:714 start_codon:yes stop_codon:yes gene_type:complete